MTQYIGAVPESAKQEVITVNQPLRQNILINSDFNVNQRGYVNGTNRNYNIFTRDRWFNANGAASENFTFDGAGKCTLSNNDALLGQRIEITEGMKAGDKLTMSWKGTAIGYLGEYIPNGGSHLITSAEVTAGFILVFFGGASATLWEPKVEYGSSVTPWEVPDIATELARCERFYWRNNPSYTYGNFCNGYAHATTQFRGTIVYPTTMRANPTISAGGNLRVMSPATGGQTLTSATLVAGTATGKVSATVACTISGATTGQGALISANNDATAYIAFDAEL